MAGVKKSPLTENAYEGRQILREKSVFGYSRINQSGILNLFKMQRFTRPIAKFPPAESPDNIILAGVIPSHEVP